MHRIATWQLFAVCVLVWATTWHAITYQVGGATPESGVAWRFALAGGVVLGCCVLRRMRLRYTLREHAHFAWQGAFLYGVSYVCVYHAEQHVVSGLVAVGYSASPLANGLGARWLYGVRVPPRFVFGGVLGIVGVALIFWPEFAKPPGHANVALGALFTLASVVLSTVGSLAASRNGARGLPLWPALGYGMLYGALAAALVALVQGHGIVPDAAALVRPSWWAGLLYLALAGSVLTFACFLTLQERIGPGPTGTVGVMTPLFALGVSMALEGFQPDAPTFFGAALAVLGNVLMLRRT